MTLRFAQLTVPALALASWMSGCSSASQSDGAGAPKPGSTDGGVEAAAPSTLANGCPMNSGFSGDSMCLAPPAAADGFQLHYGPTDYESATNETPYILQPSQETVSLGS